MEKGYDMYISDKGKHFVLTKKGQQMKAFSRCQVGEPYDDYENYIPFRLIDEEWFEEVEDSDWITMPGFKVVRDYKGKQLSCGNPYIFHNKEMAERYRDNQEKLYKSWGSNDKPYIIDAIYEGKKPKPNKKYKGRTLFVEHNWWGEIGKIGDLVEGKIAMWFAECVPPRTFTKYMIQCGEPDSGSKEGTLYSTFIRIDDDVWEYKGECLAGHTEQDWTPIPIVY